MNNIKLILLSLFVITALTSCSSSKKNPGFSIQSTPDDFKIDVGKSCSSKYDDWVTLSNIPIRPTLGISKIKQILSAIHNIGLTHFEGCSDAGIEKDLEKAFIFLQLANDFEYIPTRYVLGKALVNGDVIEQDIDLGRTYLQQVIYCDRSFGSKYGKQAESFLKEADLAFSEDTGKFDKNCNQIRGAYFKGPTIEFDALAFKADWEGRSATISKNWGWLGAGFRGTTTIVREALPVALAGASAYYAAKTSQEYRFIPQESLPPLIGFSGSSENDTFSSGYDLPSDTGQIGENQIFTSDVRCTSDFQCGPGRVCVKPQGGFSLTGLCGTLVDEYGVPTYTVPAPTPGPHSITACNFDLDCPMGFKCKKAGSDMSGVCIR